MAAETACAPSITQMCSWLRVSRSGYYEWKSRPDSAAAKRRQELKLLITKAFEDSDGTYGYRRVALQLARWGVAGGLELVRALMRELGLVACQPRPWRPSTTKQGQAGPIPDLVARDFGASENKARDKGERAGHRGAGRDRGAAAALGLRYRPRGAGAAGSPGVSASPVPARWVTYGPAGVQLVSVGGSGRVVAAAVQVPAGRDGRMPTLTAGLSELDATGE